MPVTLSALRGLWRRDYLQLPSAPADRSTWVAWLQGRRYYCDLRQPADLPDLSHTGCLAELSLDDMRALASQEGFAGELTVNDAIADWQRRYDYQPRGPYPDRAAVALQGEVLVETGIEQAYVEQWTRANGRIDDTYGAMLVDDSTGCRGVVVRTGGWLMYARGRSALLPAGRTLREVIDARASLAATRHFMDFEISFGTLSPHGTWHIDRSTLPYKAGRTWRLELPTSAGESVIIGDVTAEGQPLVRVWSPRDPD